MIKLKLPYKELKRRLSGFLVSFALFGTLLAGPAIILLVKCEAGATAVEIKLDVWPSAGEAAS